MIKIKNLCKSYNGIFNSLSNVSLSVKSGEGIVVFGEEGAGKSTLLDVIAGVKDFSGNIKIGDRDRKCLKNSEIKLSYNKSAPVLFKNRSVGFNLKYFFRVYEKELSKIEIAAKIEDVSKKFGFFDKLKKSVISLSLQEKFFLALARSYLKKPQILLIDIPNGLYNKDFIDKLIFFINLFCVNFKSAIIITTENLDVAKSLKLPLYFMYFGTLYSPEIINKADNNPPNFEVYKLFAKPIYIEEFSAIRHTDRVEFVSPKHKFFVKIKDFEGLPEFIKFEQNSFLVASKTAKPFEDTKNVEKFLSENSRVFVFDKISGLRIL